MDRFTKLTSLDICVPFACEVDQIRIAHSIASSNKNLVEIRVGKIQVFNDRILSI